MNLHSIVRGAIRTVNPDVSASWKRSTGYTTASNGQQTPTYATTATITVQEQALAERELSHMDAMNIGGVLRGFWANGDLASVDHTTNKGGDLITVPSGTYLIVHVIEAWSASGWCHVVGQRQKP